MILGVMSDTHTDRLKALPHIIAEFRKRGVETIIHCGDLKPEHMKPEFFGNLPVICALTEDQGEITPPAANWRFTEPDNRIVNLGEGKAYVGHKRSFDFLTGSEAELNQTLQRIRKDNEEERGGFFPDTRIIKFSSRITS